MPQHSHPSCVESPSPRHPLTGGEVVVVTVVVVVAATLAALGLPAATVVEVLAGAGLVSVRLVGRTPCAEPGL